MPHLHRAGCLPAALLLVAVSLPALADPVVLRTAATPEFRHAATPEDLVEDLEAWLDQHLSNPRPPRPPRIRVIDAATAHQMRGGVSRMGQRLRGLYDPETATIHLVAPWSAGDARDVSVLLHELVHHRQTAARHFYCPGAQEPEAYDLQAEWLAERDLTLRVNRIAVVLEADCTPRDIHPD
jgi:hypothetical protein